MRELVVVGVGAQAKYIVDTYLRLGGLERISVAYLDAADKGAWAEAAGCCSALAETLVAAPPHSARGFIVGHADVDEKKDWFERIAARGHAIVNAIHPGAQISPLATLGRGIIANAGAVVQPFAKIGDGCILHAQSSVDHDCDLASFANIAPGAVLAGWVKVGFGATVSTGAVVIPGVSVGARAIVGAGATAIKDVPEGVTVIGTPARQPLRKG